MRWTFAGCEFWRFTALAVLLVAFLQFPLHQGFAQSPIPGSSAPSESSDSSDSSTLAGDAPFFQKPACTRGMKPIDYGQFFRCGDLKILVVAGSPVERAANIGQAMRDGLLSTEVVEYFGNRFLDAVVPKGESPEALRNIMSFFQNLFTRILHWNVPKEWDREIQAFAHGAKLDPQFIRRGLSLPDIAAFLQAGQMDIPLLDKLPPLGCTSAVKLFADNGMVYGRNLDFAGNTIWDKAQTLVVHLPPADSDEIKHIAIGADGMFLGGITGVNEAGLVFAVHQNYTHDRGIGLPMVFIGEQVLRKAANLYEAEQILRKYRPGPLWTFVVVDIRRREAIVAESSTQSFRIRKLKDTTGQLVQTNMSMHREGIASERIRPGFLANARERYRLAWETLQNYEEATTSVDLVRGILANSGRDTLEYTGELSTNKPITIQTSLFHSRPSGDPQNGNDRMDFYASMDEAPTASGRFVRFDLNDFWKLGTDTKDQVFFPGEILPAFKQTPELRRQELKVSAATHSFFDERDFLKAQKLFTDQGGIFATLFMGVSAFRGGNSKVAAEISMDGLMRTEKESSEELQISPDIRKQLGFGPIFEDFLWLHLVALKSMYLDADALARIDELKGRELIGAEIRELVELIKAGKDLPKRLSNISLDIVSGRIRTYPRPRPMISKEYDFLGENLQ